MRIINIRVNNNLVSKDRNELYDWLDIALKNHYKFEVEWIVIKNEKFR